MELEQVMQPEQQRQ